MGSTGASQHTNADNAKKIISAFFMSNRIHRVLGIFPDSKGRKKLLAQGEGTQKVICAQGTAKCTQDERQQGLSYRHFVAISHASLLH